MKALLLLASVLISISAIAQNEHYLFESTSLDTTLFEGDTLWLSSAQPGFIIGNNDFKKIGTLKFKGFQDEGYTIRTGMVYSNDGRSGSELSYGVKIGGLSLFEINSIKVKHSDLRDKSLGSYPYFWGTQQDADIGAIPYVSCKRGKIRITAYNTYIFQDFQVRQILDGIVSSAGESQSANVSRISAGTYRITLPYAIADTSYVVEATPVSATPAMIAVDNKTSTSFDIKVWQLGLSWLLSDVAFDLVVTRSY